ncbi:hypothetical protein QCA50_014049 [Cerrena zonata]|uniref:C2H2-type domain-containing protein n=1 Tax=Cerrena zonata TaxID=2478898 RepID=A0AAW0FZ93_9APHY
MIMIKKRKEQTKCPICPKSFERCNIGHHLRQKHGERKAPKSLCPWPDCGTQIVHGKSAMKCHMYLHTNPRAESCGHVDKVDGQKIMCRYRIFNDIMMDGHKAACHKGCVDENTPPILHHEIKVEPGIQASPIPTTDPFGFLEGLIPLNAEDQDDCESDIWAMTCSEATSTTVLGDHSGLHWASNASAI